MIPTPIRHAERSRSISSPESQGEEILRQAQNDEYSALSLRFNLLRWATLTPDLGLEWRIDRTWSILVTGSWTSWSWSDKRRRYALWELSPEVRHYIGKENRGYLGILYHLGEFNYHLGSTGKQGNLQGGSITGGYLLRLNKTLSLGLLRRRRLHPCRLRPIHPHRRSTRPPWQQDKELLGHQPTRHHPAMVIKLK